MIMFMRFRPYILLNTYMPHLNPSIDYLGHIRFWCLFHSLSPKKMPHMLWCHKSLIVLLSQPMSITRIPWNLSFRYIHCTGQFTPKMKANAEPRLLSSLVWIDSGVVVSQHRLESFFHQMKCNGMTSFMEFMLVLYRWSPNRHTMFGRLPVDYSSIGSMSPSSCFWETEKTLSKVHTVHKLSHCKS